MYAQEIIIKHSSFPDSINKDDILSVISLEYFPKKGYVKR